MVAEADYHRLVAAWLRDSFSDVEHEPRLPSGREPDFRVSTPFDSYVLEVENDFADLYNGLGQTSVYGVETGLDRVLVFPADTVDDADLLEDLQMADHTPEIETV